MSQPKVSIIVPVHNSRSYLQKCLTSLMNQTLAAIEIILVLDQPTDGSDKIAEAAGQQDDRIKLIYNKENLHTGLSRNKGMAIAKGEYIGFHDHDDYCEPRMYELLYKQAQEGGLDVARCNFSCTYTKDTKAAESIIEPYIYPEMPANWSKEWVCENVGSNGISCVIWNHIYRIDFLKQHNIQFLDSREVCSEDSIFFIQVYNKVERLGLVSDYLYYHVFHSSNTGKAYNYRSIEHRISFFNELYSFFTANNITEKESLSYLSRNVVSSLYSGSRQALLTLSFCQALRAISSIRGNNLMMNCIDYLYRKDNKESRRSLKFTVIFFSYLLKCLGRKTGSTL